MTTDKLRSSQLHKHKDPIGYTDPDMRQHWISFNKLLNYAELCGWDPFSFSEYRELYSRLIEKSRLRFFQQRFKEQDEKEKDLIGELVSYIRKDQRRYSVAEPTEHYCLEDILGPLGLDNEFQWYGEDFNSPVLWISYGTKEMHKHLIKEQKNIMMGREAGGSDRRRFRICVESIEAKIWRSKLQYDDLGIDAQRRIVTEKVDGIRVGDLLVSNYRSRKPQASKLNVNELMRQVSTIFSNKQYKLKGDLAKNFHRIKNWYTQFTYLPGELKEQYETLFNSLHIELIRNFSHDLIYNLWGTTCVQALFFRMPDEEIGPKIRLREEVRVKSSLIVDDINNRPYEADYLLFSNKRKAASMLRSFYYQNIDAFTRTIRREGYKIHEFSMDSEDYSRYMVKLDKLVLHIIGPKGSEEIANEIVTSTARRYNNTKYEDGIVRLHKDNNQRRMANCDELPLKFKIKLEDYQNRFLQDIMPKRGDLPADYVALACTSVSDIFEKFPAPILYMHTDDATNIRAKKTSYLGENRKPDTGYESEHILIIMSALHKMEAQIRDSRMQHISLESEIEYHNREHSKNKGQVGKNIEDYIDIFLGDSEYARDRFKDAYLLFHNSFMDEQEKLGDRMNPYSYAESYHKLRTFYIESRMVDDLEHLERRLKDLPVKSAVFKGKASDKPMLDNPKELSSLVENLNEALATLGYEPSLPTVHQIQSHAVSLYASTVGAFIENCMRYSTAEIDVGQKDKNKHAQLKIACARVILDSQNLFSLMDPDMLCALEPAVNAKEYIVRRISDSWDRTDSGNYLPKGAKPKGIKRISGNKPALQSYYERHFVGYEQFIPLLLAAPGYGIHSSILGKEVH